MKTMRQLLLLTFFVVTCVAVSAQDVRPTSYTLELTVLPEQNRIVSIANVSLEHAEALGSEVVFYLHGELRVDSIKVNDADIPFLQDKVFYAYNYSLVATKVSLESQEGILPKEITIHYSGFFHPSRARSPSDYMRVTEEGAFLRSYGYSLWFPVFLESNEKAHNVSFEKVTIKTPKEFTAVFVGNFVRSHTQGDSNISEWSAKDIDIFDAQCTASAFALLREDNYFVYSLKDQQSLEKARDISAFTKNLDALYKSNYGELGGSSQLHIMQMPQYGNISNHNVVGISSDLWREFDQKSFAGRTLAHEMVHPFVRLDVPKDDPLFALVIEGFPSYFYLPILAEHISEDFYQQFIRRVSDSYIQKQRTGKDRRGRSLPPERAILSIPADEIGVYKDVFVLNDRVLLFFDYIRRKLGKKQFMEFSKELFNLDRIDANSFESHTLKYMPNSKDDLALWLRSTEFPARLRVDTTTNK